MLIVGLTGGIASGKTTVAELFKELNIPIIDADVIAKNLSSPPKMAYKKIVKHFGSQIINKQQQLNRKKLRSIIFSDPKERRWLEKLLHPLIIKEILAQIKKTKAHYCIVVIPLLLEAGRGLPLQRILVVETQRKLQISRALVRDKAKSDDIEKIIKAQANQKERLAIADDVIINNHSHLSLKKKVNQLHHFYLVIARRAAKKQSRKNSNGWKI